MGVNRFVVPAMLVAIEAGTLTEEELNEVLMRRLCAKPMSGTVNGKAYRVQILDITSGAPPAGSGNSPAFEEAQEHYEEYYYTGSATNYTLCHEGPMGTLVPGSGIEEEE